MPSNTKSSSTVMQNNVESYRRSSKRKLQPQPVHNACVSFSNTTMKDQKPKLSFLSEEEKKGNQKLVILECEDMGAFPEKFSQRAFFAPLNERSINNAQNVIIVKDENMNSRNLQRGDNSFAFVEDNETVSSSRGEATKDIKELHLGDTSMLSDSSPKNEGQCHTTPVEVQLPVATTVKPIPLSIRDHGEEVRKTISKLDSAMDGVRTPASSNAIRIIPKSDEFDSIGHNIAAKLRRLPREQCILAEKLLHDVLYEAAMGMLNRTSRLLTVSPYGPNWGNMSPFNPSLSAPNNSLNEFNLYSRSYGFCNP